MAGNPSIRTVGEELGLLDPTPIEGEGASGVETAARWRRQQIVDYSRNRWKRGSRRGAWAVIGSTVMESLIGVACHTDSELTCYRICHDIAKLRQCSVH